MSISLSKGQKISLKKENGTTLRRIMVGLGWDEAQPSTGGGLFGLFKSKPVDIDCDASAILCGQNGKLASRDTTLCCVYYGNLRHPSGAIVHQGDNLTGGGDGDSEQLMVDLEKVPSNIHKIVFVVNIYEADKRNQHFGMINNAYIRLVNRDDNTEFCRYSLSDNYMFMTGLIVGEVVREDSNWKFEAIGNPVKDASHLSKIVNMYT